MNFDDSRSVVIAGVSCELAANVDSTEKLFEFCSAARCAAAVVPASRWNHEIHYHPDHSKKGHYNVEAGAFLERDPASFDAPFFSISGSEARAMDPQHRLLLQSSYAALENAGIPLRHIAGRSDVGVFTAVSRSDYCALLEADALTIPRYTASSNAGCMFANRLSYYYNVHGPSIAVDSACSSGLSALSLAADSITTGRCEIAIVGGAFLQLSPLTVAAMGALGTLSPEGTSRAFDSSADGYGKGDGVACVVLASRAYTERANGPARAVLRAVAVNHCGHSSGGITVPHGPSQIALMRDIYAKSGLDPLQTVYVEAHGTGTERGDLIEADSIAQAFEVSERSASHPLYIGSVKTNFGHSEAVSGIVSLVKCIAMIEAGLILPNANFKNPNSVIKGYEGKLKVPTECVQWPHHLPLRISINNFGFGGSNAHVILEASAIRMRESRPGMLRSSRVSTQDMAVRRPRLFHFSAKDKQALLSMLRQYQQHFGSLNLKDDCLEIELMEDLAYTLNCRRNMFDWRATVVAGSIRELTNILQSEDIVNRRTLDRNLVLVFTGQGSIWPAMASSLMQVATFALSLKRAERMLARLGASWSLIGMLSELHNESEIQTAAFSQPAVTAIQLALVELLREWSIEPAAVIGHSSGEIAAAFASEAIDFETALGIAYYRGQVVSSTISTEDHCKGSMIAVGASPEEVEPLVASLNDGIATIACFNSPDSITVAGDMTAVNELQVLLEARGVFCRRLPVDQAYHSDHMLPFVKPYFEAISQLLRKRQALGGPPTLVFSSVTGAMIRSEQLRSPWYWVSNLALPVRFLNASKALAQHMAGIGMSQLLCVEIGPHRVLGTAVQKSFDSSGANPVVKYLPSLLRGFPASECLLQMAVSIASAGFAIDIERIHHDLNPGARKVCLTNLPPYPFNETQRYWNVSRLALAGRENGSPWNIVLGHKINDSLEPALQCRNVFTLDDIPWLRDHVVKGAVVFPLAGYICAVVEGLELQRKKIGLVISGYELTQLSVLKALTLDEDKEYELWTTLYALPQLPEKAKSKIYHFDVTSWSSGRGHTLHCSGTAALLDAKLEGGLDVISERPVVTREQAIINSFHERSAYELDCEHLYRSTNRSGLQYGPYFQRVQKLRVGTKSAHGTIVACDTASCTPGQFEGNLKVHPTMLDSALQVGCLHLGGNPGDPAGIRTHVPISVERVFIDAALEYQHGLTLDVYSHGFETMPESRSTKASLLVCSPGTSNISVEIQDITLVDLDDSEGSTMAADLINPHKVAWLDHPDFVDLQKYTIARTPEEIAELQLMLQASQVYISQALEDGRSEVSRPHLVHMLNWMRTQQNGSADSACLHTLQRMRDTSVTAEFIANVGPALPQVLFENTEPLEPLLKDDCLWRFYEQSVIFAEGKSCMVGLIARLALLQPSMTILEVGAGTGGFTMDVMRAVTSSTGSARFEHYDFTDISTGFFQRATEKLAEWADKVDFRKLDLNMTPDDQGFEASSYDLILAADVIHATENVSASLRNLYHVLRPGGILVLNELSKFSPICFPFGLLQGWWAQGARGPWFSKDEWSNLLRQSGFGDMKGFWEDELGNCVFWACKTVDPEEQSTPLPLAIVASEESKQFAAELHYALFAQDSLKGHELFSLSLQDAKSFAGPVVCLQDSTLSPSNADAKVFHDVKALLCSKDNVLWLTRDGIASSEDCSEAFVLGFARVLHTEDTKRRFIVFQSVSKDTSTLAAHIAYVASKSLLCDGDTHFEREWREENGQLQFARLMPDDTLAQGIRELMDRNERTTRVPLSTCHSKITASLKRPGDLTSLSFASHNAELYPYDEQVNLGEHEVVIKVEAAGVNFRDLLITLGRVPNEPLGKECSGVVLAAGTQASKSYQPGDRVLHWGDGTFSNEIRCHADSLSPIPKGLSMHAAAAIPVVYGTVYHCLVNVAAVRAGERVLIHAASGAVGQAAIILCQWLKAEIYCTVSTLEKKKLVMQQYEVPAERIYSSRSPHFTTFLMAATGNKGVDVILNSLAGEMLKATWSCVATGGRFIEIGKYDALVNNKLDMAPFARGASYSAVDLSLTIANEPRFLRTVTDALEKAQWRMVHPVTVYPLGDLQSAFRAMQAGKHLGKIVLSMDPAGEVELEVPKPRTPRLSRTRPYIITGGTGGLARALVKWMVDRGARAIHLLSRSGARGLHTVSWAATLSQAADVGANVTAHVCDVADREELVKVLASLSEFGAASVAGVIHGAMVLRDQLYENASADAWGAVIAPKIKGAVNLHSTLSAAALDFFVCLSSASTLGIVAGQSSYAGSNSMLDAFCKWRSANGQHSVSIALPAISDMGYVAEKAPRTGGQNLWEGRMLSSTEVKALMELSLDRALFAPDLNGCHTIAGLQKQPALLKLIQGRSPFFGVLARDTANACSDGERQTRAAESGSIPVKVLLSQARDEEAVRSVVANATSAKIATMMSIAIGDVRSESSVADLGIDSLVAVELRNWLTKEFGTTLPVLEIISSPTLSILIERVVFKYSI